MKKVFFMSVSRAETKLLAKCFASNDFFARTWNKLSSEVKEEFTTRGHVPCGSWGIPGVWCSKCRFGRLEDA